MVEHIDWLVLVLEVLLAVHHLSRHVLGLVRPPPNDFSHILRLLLRDRLGLARLLGNLSGFDHLLEGVSIDPLIAAARLRQHRAGRLVELLQRLVVYALPIVEVLQSQREAASLSLWPLRESEVHVGGAPLVLPYFFDLVNGRDASLLPRDQRRLLLHVQRVLCGFEHAPSVTLELL